MVRVCAHPRCASQPTHHTLHHRSLSTPSSSISSLSNLAANSFSGPVSFRASGVCGRRLLVAECRIHGSLGDGGSGARRNAIPQCSRVTAPQPSPSAAEALEQRFGQAGVKFKDAAGYNIVELKLDDGSSARIVLQTAVVSSYKSAMWHGGVEELLHTQVVSAGDDDGAQRPTLSGGIALTVAEAETARESVLAATTCWDVDDVISDPAQYVQVTLSTTTRTATNSCSSPSLHFKYVITLAQAALSSAVVISNAGTAPVSLQGAIHTHMAVNFVDGILAVGLQGCKYLSHPPIPTPAPSRLISERFDTRNARRKEGFLSNLQQFWGTKEVTNSVTRADDRCIVEKEEYVGLYGGFDRLYPAAPDSFSLLDRGKRRTLDFRSFGLEDIRLTNPGEESGLEDWDSFVCVGLARLTRPVLLQPGEEWRAAQVLENPSK